MSNDREDIAYSDDAELMPNVERLKELLVGRKVVDVRTEGQDYDPVGVITLDDGKVLEVQGHDGGCGCNSGCYPLASLSATDNVILNVQLDESPAEDYSDEGDGWYRVFVYTENQEIMLASFEGTDGNGYYGTGWWLRVKEAS